MPTYPDPDLRREVLDLHAISGRAQWTKPLREDDPTAHMHPLAIKIGEFIAAPFRFGAFIIALGALSIALIVWTGMVLRTMSAFACRVALIAFSAGSPPSRKRLDAICALWPNAVIIVYSAIFRPSEVKAQLTPLSLEELVYETISAIAFMSISIASLAFLPWYLSAVNWLATWGWKTVVFVAWIANSLFRLIPYWPF